MKKTILLLIVLSVLVMSGCGGPSEEEAEELFCQNLAKLGYAAGQLRALNENSAVEDVKDTVRLYQEALNDLRWSALDARDAKIGDLEDAISDLRNAIEDIEDDAAISDALASVQDEWQAVVNAYDQVNSDMECAYMITIVESSAGEEPAEEATPEATEEADS
jgi:hypothetical protein